EIRIKVERGGPDAARVHPGGIVHQCSGVVVARRIRGGCPAVIIESPISDKAVGDVAGRRRRSRDLSGRGTFAAGTDGSDHIIVFRAGDDVRVVVIGVGAYRDGAIRPAVDSGSLHIVVCRADGIVP